MTDITCPASLRSLSGNPLSGQIETIFRFRLKDPGSAITHFIGFAGAIFATPFLLIHAASEKGSMTKLMGFSIFMLSMVLLYGASSAYHSFDISPKANKLLKKIDHMMIFLLIAGTYTPICLTALERRTGTFILTLVYGIAVIGIVIKALWVTCPKWFSSVIYIGMGWVCILALPQITAALDTAAFVWLLTGGILYTIGGVIYALKLKVFNSLHKNFGSHEIFHIFVLAGSICHYMTMIYL